LSYTYSTEKLALSKSNVNVLYVHMYIIAQNQNGYDIIFI